MFEFPLRGTCVYILLQVFFELYNKKFGKDGVHAVSVSCLTLLSTDSSQPMEFSRFDPQINEFKVCKP